MIFMASTDNSLIAIATFVDSSIHMALVYQRTKFPHLPNDSISDLQASLTKLTTSPS
jgi:hypothetical protein